MKTTPDTVPIMTKRTMMLTTVWSIIRRCSPPKLRGLGMTATAVHKVAPTPEAKVTPELPYLRFHVPVTGVGVNTQLVNADAREACCQLNLDGECAVIKTFKDVTQRGQLQGLLEVVLQRLRPEAAPALNN
ncbi:hypothetical protein PHMEG_00022841 [Phytophthora megakarya]|uniref:Uncharacterized protein n=1 Tax=Phytophthora megakarya TaxID=4795 RepID=A0A225VJE4_9STRA|nr:hypothetical protein PHMEG_00022841 [Phytophthora megakarya]